MKTLTLAYLVAYNILQWTGWAAIMEIVLYHLAQTGGSYRNVFNTVELPLVIVQLATILETLHSITGVSKSSTSAAFMQFLGRGLALFVYTRSIPEVRYDIGVTGFILCWALIDIVRYSYYLTTLLGCPPYALVWLRYTSFIPLYPLGYGCELKVIYTAMAAVWKTGQYSFTVAGVAVNFYYVLCAYCALSCFGFVQNYSYMFAQRRKALKKAKTA